MGPISPELVLVDPELARIERARLVERARLDSMLDLVPAAPATASVVEPTRAVDSRPRHRRDASWWMRARLMPAVLALSLFTNGVLAGVRIGGKGSETSPPPPSVALQAARLGPGISVRPSAAPALRTKGAVERKILALVIEAPAGKLPPALIDRTTGLAKDNLQAICHRTRAARSFLCVVQLQGHAANAGLHVRYRAGRGGRGVFTWYPYR